MLPIIETYEQLAYVVGTLAIALVAVRTLWPRHRRTVVAAAEPVVRMSKDVARSPSRASRGIDFDKLAGMISDATDRATTLAATQSAAALKLDTAEVAVNRLFADIDGIMHVDRRPLAAIAGAAPAAASMAASRAA